MTGTATGLSRRLRARGLVVLASVLLAGCMAGPRFQVAGVDRALTPASAVAVGGAAVGHRVLWGGVIVRGLNLAHATRLEVLAYPLDANQEPDTDARPLGRFMIRHPGYLETAIYAPGRHVTVIGTLRGTETGMVGQARYVYPVVIPAGMYLWPKQNVDTGPRWHFGVGIGVVH